MMNDSEYVQRDEWKKYYSRETMNSSIIEK